MDDHTKRIIGWCLYDWANSAFATVMLTAVLPPYFLNIAPATIRVGPFRIPAESLWSYGLGGAAFLIALLMPVLGAMADAGEQRGRWWVRFALIGIGATALTGIVPPSAWSAIIPIFVFGQLGFSGGNVFYNALLTRVTSPESYDRVSAWGFGAGYAGGGIALALVLLWVRLAPSVGFPELQAVRHGFLLTAGWWLGFGLLSFHLTGRLEPPSPPPMSWRHRAREGWTQTLRTLRKLRRYQHAFRFLIAFLIYNDGVQTTIALAAVFGKSVLHLSTAELISVILIVQFIALPGSLGWEWVARRTGTGRAIEALLISWTLLTAAAGFIRSAGAFYLIAAGFALVLGGIQALSRSFFARLIPSEASAEFFGFYSVTARFSAVLGPIWVGVITQWTGSMRVSIVGLILFYLTGWGLFRTLPRSIRG